MAADEKKSYSIDGYQYAMYAGRKSSGVKAIVDLIQNKRRLARVFFSNEYSLPQATKKESGGFELHYSFEDFPHLVDMLRNEKPLYFLWRGPDDARISTGPEPIGEGE